MKNAEPLYLSARAAAGELSVSLATLYAYVSRGMIRSEPVPDSRARRYRAEDVRALKQRRAPPAGARATEGPALESAVSTIGPAGPIYRGVPAVGLAASATLEQVATLLWDATGGDPFAPANLPVVSDTMHAVLAATAGEAPLSRAASVLALAGAADPAAFNRSREGAAQLAARAMRLLAAAVLGQEASASPLHGQVTEAWVPAKPAAADLLRRALVLLADHELNASTFTLRCAASTGVSLYDAAVAGLAALKGPRHGGAGPLAAQLVAELAVGDSAAKVRGRAAAGEAFPGFGHSVYEAADPRAENLLAALLAAGAHRHLAESLPALVAEATGLPPNIDFALAVLMRELGLPPGHETALFAIARSAGWMAHAMEQQRTGTLIRPRARYTGPMPQGMLA